MVFQRESDVHPLSGSTAMPSKCPSRKRSSPSFTSSFFRGVMRQLSGRSAGTGTSHSRLAKSAAGVSESRFFDRCPGRETFPNFG